jgi:disease resistance protein RPM1
VKENQSTELCRSLSKMRFLSYLSIIAWNENVTLQLDDLHLPQIQKLVLYGRLKENTLESLLLRISVEGIQTLRLGWSQRQNDPLSSLSCCKNLTYLKLQKAYEGHQLTFKTEWFPKLKKLVLRQMSNLVQVEMEQSTLESLEELYLSDLKKLDDVPKGIEHLRSLRWMGCRDMPVEFGGLAKGKHRLHHFTCIVI